MKLKDYLDQMGIKYAYFAKEVGINPTLFNDALNGRRMIPLKHWKKITELTNRKVKLEDLYNETFPQ